MVSQRNSTITYPDKQLSSCCIYFVLLFYFILLKLESISLIKILDRSPNVILARVELL